MENGQLHSALPCASEGNTVRAIVEAHRERGNPTEVWVVSVGGIRAEDQQAVAAHLGRARDSKARARWMHLRTCTSDTQLLLVVCEITD